jgi:hypothetical protein
MTETEWVDRHVPELAEAAEALGVPTDQVAAVGILDNNRSLAWYTPDPSGILILRVTLSRDDYGVLRKLDDEVEDDVPDEL